MTRKILQKMGYNLGNTRNAKSKYEFPDEALEEALRLTESFRNNPNPHVFKKRETFFNIKHLEIVEMYFNSKDNHIPYISEKTGFSGYICGRTIEHYIKNEGLCIPSKMNFES